MDRANLSLARAANGVLMDKQIGTNLGDRYSIITLLFFIPYIIFEVPSQIGLRKFGVRNWLGASTILWGIVTLAMGFVSRTGDNRLTSTGKELGNSGSSARCSGYLRGHALPGMCVHGCLLVPSQEHG